MLCFDGIVEDAKRKQREERLERQRKEERDRRDKEQRAFAEAAQALTGAAQFHVYQREGIQPPVPSMGNVPHHPGAPTAAAYGGSQPAVSQPAGYPGMVPRSYFGTPERAGPQPPQPTGCASPPAPAGCVIGVCGPHSSSSRAYLRGKLGYSYALPIKRLTSGNRYAEAFLPRHMGRTTACIRRHRLVFGDQCCRAGCSRGEAPSVTHDRTAGPQLPAEAAHSTNAVWRPRSQTGRR